MSIGDEIKKARKKKGLSQEALATLMELNRVAISNYENNKNHPTFENIEKLSEILGIDLGTNKKIVTKIVPLIGNASCGIPTDFDLNTYEPIAIPADMYKTDMYAVKAIGNSMSPKINEGDIVFCCPGTQVDNGNIVHYTLDGEAGIKKYKINEKQTIISLVPLNQDYDIITIHCDDNVNLSMSKVTGKIDRDF